MIMGMMATQGSALKTRKRPLGDVRAGADVGVDAAPEAPEHVGEAEADEEDGRV
jgi:hypothetical protein